MLRPPLCGMEHGMRMTRLVSVIGISILAAGCGGSGSSSVCDHPPANTAPVINDMYSANAVPTDAAGGTLESGTYFMTAITDYGQASGSGTHQDTMVLDASAGTFIVMEVNGGQAKAPIGGTLTQSGSELTQTFECPSKMSAMVAYTAVPGTLTIYNYQAKSVSVWAKQ